MRRIIILITVAITFSLAVQSKSPEKQIREVMESGDWFALDSLYKAAPENSISDFIYLLSRCLIGNRMNRPDISIPAFEQLLANHSEDLSNIITYALLYAVDLSKVGDNAKAASMLSALLEAQREQFDSISIKNLETAIKRYECLTKYKPYAITFNDNTGNVPFSIIPAGRPEKKGVLMRLENSTINGRDAKITFDTGAAINIISDSLVEKYNLIPLEVETKVAGFQSHTGKYAIAKELKIGNITVEDVPFYVMAITSHNEEADKYMKDLSLIVGSDLMLRLKDVTIDFVDNKITVPAQAPDKTESAPNLCFSSSMNLLARGSIQDNALLMNIDTGDASYGTVGKTFFKKNKKLVKSIGKPTTIKRAGLGGANITEGYLLPDASLNLGGNMVALPSIEIIPDNNPFGYECNLGLKSLMLFKQVRFNLVDFVLTTVK